jgi:phosphate transport system permease protein
MDVATDSPLSGPGRPRGAAKAAPRGLRLRLADPLFRVLVTACGAFVAVAMLALSAVLIFGSWEAITTLGFEPLTTVAWNPSAGNYGALSSLVGTLLTTVIAMMIAVPLALAIAMLLVEIIHPALGRVVGTTIEMLAAIPSIIFGMWGIFVVVPLMQRYVEPWIQKTPLGELPLFSGPPLGLGVLTAGIVLALMILPFITAVARDVLRMVPKVVKEAGYGLGSTTFEVMRSISLRYALTGIAGAVFLGLGRALGETMAVTFIVGGNVATLPRSLFDPGTTISATLANTFSEATKPLQVSALVELGLILFVITMVFQLVAQVWLSRARRMTGTRA